MTEQFVFDGEPVKVGFWKFDGFAKQRSKTGHRGMDLLAEILFEAITAPLPSVFDHVDHEWDPKERDLVVEYVSDQSFRGIAYFGDSTCRICGARNGSADFSDGKYVWPEGLPHYLKVHGVKPPTAFVKHVLRRRR
jgi:hypothetical protein